MKKWIVKFSEVASTFECLELCRERCDGKLLQEKHGVLQPLLLVGEVRSWLRRRGPLVVDTRWWFRRPCRSSSTCLIFLPSLGVGCPPLEFAGGASLGGA